MAVRRAVHDRDGGRCTHVDSEGRRCTETRACEIDHIVPWARGGASTVENTRILCRRHNAHAARRAFGAGLIALRIARARDERRGAT
jgi:5-methylcytosine-specific restriction endonuclease McrA